KDAKGREVKKKQMATDHTLPRLLWFSSRSFASFADEALNKGGRRPAPCEGDYAPRVSRVFWNLLACERSALARVSNQSAISSKPSARASLAMPGYMSV